MAPFEQLVHAFGPVRFRYCPVTVHGLNPYPPHDLVHVELQVPVPLDDAGKERLWVLLRAWLGDKFDRIWTVAFLGPQDGDQEGLPLAELSTLLDDDYF
jgi:hypothetical protein